MTKPTNILYQLLETLAQIAIPEGIYRIQRNELASYPKPIPEASRDTIDMLYNQFEQTWIDTYDTNPYAVLTNGRLITGDNSELTFHLNPLERICYVNYNIQSANNEVDAIGYPLSIPMTNPISDRPLIDNMLYLEALGKKENIACFYTGNILYYEKDYPIIPAVWKQIKQQLANQLEEGYRLDVITDNEWAKWSNGLEHNEMIVNLHDPNVMDMPSISVYGEDVDQEDEPYATQATLGLVDAAFLFRHKQYKPFAKLL